VDGDSRSSSPANAASSGEGRAAGLRPGGSGASAGIAALIVSFAVGAFGASGGVERRGRGGSGAGCAIGAAAIGCGAWAFAGCPARTGATRRLACTRVSSVFKRSS
jgi:hypothetical protein